MDKIEKGHPLSQSPDMIQENLAKLKQLFPTIVKEGKIDVTELQALLGEEIETGDEYYRFSWAGKSHARQEANKPSTGTLRPDKAASKDWDTTGNLFIEGDNLEVLKLLQKSYAGKVKMIYIDPPYNTGKDFVYKDNYKDNLGNYLAITGQTDEAGRKLSTNTESDGRYHSNWLNMMYPRLKLAHNLLRDDGVIFISIDDNEVHNLKKICDEVFGETNFVSELIWERAYSPKNDAKFISNSHDYVIFYAKSIESFQIGRLERTEEANARYQNPDNDPRGVWKPSDLSVKTYTAECDYPIETPSGRIVEPPAGRCWSLSKNAFFERLQDNRIWFGSDGNSVPSIKRFLTELKYDGMAPTSILFYKEVGHSQEGAKEVVSLLDGKGHFDGPKPRRLISRLITLANTDPDSVVLDFFAGSGTTAHAVMQLNAEDGGNRKFICVQLPEPTEPESEAYKAGYKVISDITKERIRRAGAKIAAEWQAKQAAATQAAGLFASSSPLSSTSTSPSTLDTGFRAFKLDTSNIVAWDGSIENFEANLLSAAENIKHDRSQEDVLFEILLKAGLDLTVPIEEKSIDGKTVYNIGAGALFVCLANELTTAIAEGIGQWKQQLAPATCRVIFRDTGFTDVVKTNSIQILRRYGVEEVNTI